MLTFIVWHYKYIGLDTGITFCKLLKMQKDKLAGSPGENGEGYDAQKDLHSRTGRNETKRKTQEKIKRRSGKRSSSVGSEKMERVGDR
jgi:hypothetical protein